MKSAALRVKSPEASYSVATVEAVEGSQIVVRVLRSRLAAERAASCLVAPEAGDEVAIVITSDERAFVIAVLVAAADRPVEVAVDGDLRIRATGTLSFVSSVMNMHAGEGSLVLGKLAVLASSIVATSDGVRFVARTFDGFVDRLSQTAKRCYRKVEELDQLRAERVDYRTEHEMSLRSENFLVSARKLAKVDAEQIHIG